MEDLVEQAKAAECWADLALAIVAAEPIFERLATWPPPALEPIANEFLRQVSQADPGHGEKAPVGRDAHDRLGQGEGDQLGVTDPSAGVSGPGGQEIVGGDINRGAEGVEVGVHRGPRVDGAFATADFGPSARGPFSTALSVESVI